MGKNESIRRWFCMFVLKGLTMIEKLSETQTESQRYKIVRKLNEVIDAVNALVYEQDKDSDWYDETRAENVQPSKIICANKRLRKALGIAQTALVKLANDAYDMDEHIYIDGILNQIERITKGGKDE